MLEAGWIEQNHGRFDVFHIHFGFDAVTPNRLQHVVDVLRHHGKPLVYTVHDLRNPHQPDHRTHEVLLDILVPSADQLITLTNGAALEVRRRWNRTALVLAHPHVVPRRWLEKPREPHDGFVIGVHLKSLRPSMDPVPVIEALLEWIDEWPDAVLQLNVHHEIHDPDNHWYAPALVRDLARWSTHPRVRLFRHEYFQDEELWTYLSSLDVSVLPYRFGTHSGWLEACHDLGTGVVAPDCGYYAEQRQIQTYHFDQVSALDPKSLRAAIEGCRTEPARRPGLQERSAERRWLAREHHRIYQGLIG